MRSSQITVGSTYTARVSGNLVPVRITGTFGYMSGKTFRDGWLATNTVTGREIKIKSPQRLRAIRPSHFADEPQGYQHGDSKVCSG